MNRFIIAEPKLCIGCNTCMAACTQVHKKVGLVDPPRLVVTRDDNGTAPVLCRHCEDAPCAKVCPVNAITFTKRSVRINESTCIGCKLCGIACPFGAISPAACKPEGVPEVYEQYIPQSMLSDVPRSPASMSPFLAWNAGQKVVAVKCDLCYFREEGPACIQSCPTNALFMVDDQVLEHANETKREQSIEWLAQMSAQASALSDTTSGGK